MQSPLLNSYHRFQRVGKISTFLRFIWCTSMVELHQYQAFGHCIQCISRQRSSLRPFPVWTYLATLRDSYHLVGRLSSLRASLWTAWILHSFVRWRRPTPPRADWIFRVVHARVSHTSCCGLWSLTFFVNISQLQVCPCVAIAFLNFRPIPRLIYLKDLWLQWRLSPRGAASQSWSRSKSREDCLQGSP